MSLQRDPGDSSAREMDLSADGAPTVPHDLTAMLDLLAETIVSALGFGVAVINIACPDGSMQVASVAGDEQARGMLLGTADSAEIWDQVLAVSEHWGRLRFADHRNDEANPEILSWIPEMVPLDHENAWHPLDALFAPLIASDGSRLGILSVDLPRDGLRPDRATCTALEAFAISTALAIEHARQAARFRARFEQAPTPQALLNMRGEHLAVNDAYCELLGWSRDELIQQSAKLLAHPSIPSLAKSTFDALALGQLSSASYEAILQHRSGRPIPVQIDVTVLNNSDGTPLEMASTVRDLTAVRSANERLAKQEGLYQALSRRASDVAIVSDAETLITYVSPSVTEIFGFEPEDILGVAGWDFAHPEDRPSLQAAVERVLSAQHEVEQIRIRAKDARAEWRWVEATISNRLDDPDIGGLVANLRDITAEVESQLDLRRSETRYRTIVETAQEGLAVLDLNGKPLVANQKLADILGLSLEDTYRAHLTTLFDASLTAELDSKLKNRTRVGSESYELAYPHPDGTERTLAISAAPFQLEKTGEAGSLVMVGDVTEQRKATAGLEASRADAVEASRLKSEFLATISHEIRTPMNGVIGLAGLLLETSLDETQRQYAEGVQVAGEALLSLLNNVLDLSKLEAGKVELDSYDFDPRRLLDEVASLIAPSAHVKELELVAHCQAALPAKLLGDGGRIRQILLNLASNAVKFTQTGEVTITAGATPLDDGRVLVRFEVADTGIGIAAQGRSRLFESFSQADASTTRRYGGTGLGLAISRRLTDALDGTIGVESELGSGSAFWFQVPLRVADPTGRVDPSLTGDLLEDLRVLVVDDNARSRLVLGSQLAAWGALVDLVEQPDSVLAMMREAVREGRPYAVALVDMSMPGVDGIDVARLIFSDPLLDGTRLIMLTSTTQLIDSDELSSVGVHEWLAKPVSSAELYERLMRMVTPLHEDDAAAPSDRRAPPEASLGRVLLVEDNAVNQMVAEAVVSKLGYEVDVAENGLEALNALETTYYSAVLMDCHMPLMDGLEATREIRRRQDDGDAVPIVAMTAGASESDRERCLAAGMDAYLSKPIVVAAVRDTLTRLARQSPDQSPRFGAQQDRAVIDPQRELILRDIGSDVFGLVIEAFLRDFPTTIAAMRRAVQTGDLHSLKASAHRLKGSAVNLGVPLVAELCSQIEEISGEPTFRADEVLARLETELADASRLLQRARAHPSGDNSLRPGP